MGNKSITHATAPQQAQLLQAQASKASANASALASANAGASASITAQTKTPNALVQNAIVQPNATVVNGYKLNPNYGKFYTNAQSNTGLTPFTIACNIAQLYGFSRWHFVKLAGKNAGVGQPVCNLFKPVIVGRNKFVSATQAQLHLFYKCIVATGNLAQAISAMQPVTQPVTPTK
jgi:hypothetical protein